MLLSKMMPDSMKTPYLSGDRTHVPDELMAILEGTTGDVIWFDTGLMTPNGNVSYLFTQPLRVIRCDSIDDLPAFFKGMEDALGQGLWLAGWFCYEWGYLLHERLLHLLDRHSPALPLAFLLVFKRPCVWVHDKKPSSAARDIACPSMQPGVAQEIWLDVTKDQYLGAIERIKGYIQSGDTYQVNYTIRSRFKAHRDLDALSLYMHLRGMQPVPYGAFMRIGDISVLSCSPELFFRRDGGWVITRPMKGTAKRGRTLEEDREIAQQLHLDIKNRAENIMIVDLLRNDLGRIATVGSVEVPELFCVERYSTLFQMTSTVRARIPSNVSYEQLLRALFPSGSVTGAPKLRTMEIIAELEASPRRIYTGAIGFISPFDTACFNVAIRTLVLEGEQLELGIGSGVTIGSDPQSEYDECRLKAEFFVRCPENRPDFQLIETMLWDPDRLKDDQPLSPYFLLDRHMRRMADSAHYFDFPWDEHGVLSRLSELSQKLICRRVRTRVRLTLSRVGELGVTWQDLIDMGQGEVVVGIAEVRTHSNDVFLYHKTTHRPIYDVEHAKAVAKGYFDCIFLNERNEITEGAITNIFVRKRDGEPLVTPPIFSGLLNGTLRQELLERGEAVEAPLYLDDLIAADAVFIGNSVRGLRPARIITTS